MNALAVLRLRTARPKSSIGRRIIPSDTWATLLIGTLTVAHVAYLFLNCPLELAPDEAHYWDWSRRLDTCYYSKGPLIAWLVRAGCELFGGLSVALTGTLMPAVRLPAVGCFALFLVAVYRLGRDCGGPRLGLTLLVVGATLPPVQALGTLMTIDPPFLACWAWGCVALHAAMIGGRRWGWPVAGAVVAVGLLAKSTMLLLPACAAGFLLTTPKLRREQGLRAVIWLGLGCLAGLAPIVEWNARHDWVGVRHIWGHAAGGTKEKGIRWLGPLTYFGTQWAMLAGTWFGLIVLGLWRGGRAILEDPQDERIRASARRLLWWLTALPFVLFAAASFVSRGQPNWPAPAYVAGAVLATLQWQCILRAGSPGVVRFWKWSAVASIVGGILATAVMHRPNLVRPIFAAVATTPSADRPTPIRQLDPTCRLAGWRELAAAVDRLRDQVRAEEGREPDLAVMNWNMAGELGFYCRGNPCVYSFAAFAEERHSQYDVWRPNPTEDAQAFRARTFLYVGERFPEWAEKFDQVEGPVEVYASDGPVPVAFWQVWVGRGFRGQSGDGRRVSRRY